MENDYDNDSVDSDGKKKISNEDTFVLIEKIIKQTKNINDNNSNIIQIKKEIKNNINNILEEVNSILNKDELTIENERKLINEKINLLDDFYNNSRNECEKNIYKLESLTLFDD
jgi:S-adenosylmethionine:tRNA-ribosyltransferase-isomerase (queuine synthetase)